jgi:hypothetical protein
MARISGRYASLRFVERFGSLGSSLLLAAGIIVGIVAIASDLFQIGGIQGTWARLGLAVLTGILMAGGLSLTTLVRWWLLYRALRDFVQKIPITKDTILVSGGPGGAIAAGMLSKAAQERLQLEEPPSLLVIDTEYDRSQRVLCARGIKVQVEHPERVLCVASHVGSGRLLAEMKKALGLPSATRTFALVYNPDCRLDVDFALHEGRRSILPWPRAGGEGNVV